MVAVILLSVSLLFIALCHFFTASSGVCSFSWITLSHLSTQMRCAASEIIIWRSLDTPLILMENLLLLSSCLFRFPEFAVRHLHPMIVPRLDLEPRKGFMAPQRHKVARNVTVCPALQCRRMCCMFSVASHGAHIPLCWWPWTLNHFSLIIGMLWIALKKNCCTLKWMLHFCMLCQIVSLISWSPWYVQMASFARSMLLFMIACVVLIFCILMPLYATACVSLSSLAPCRSNSFGMSRVSSSALRLLLLIFRSLCYLGLLCVL